MVIPMLSMAGKQGASSINIAPFPSVGFTFDAYSWTGAGSATGITKNGVQVTRGSTTVDGNTGQWLNALDLNTGTNTNDSVGNNNMTLHLVFSVAQTFTEYGVTALVSSTPTAWTLEGSNNGSSWTAIDTRTGQSTWTSGVERLYTIASPASYTHYRVVFTSSSFQPSWGYVTVQEFRFTQ